MLGPKGPEVSIPFLCVVFWKESGQAVSVGCPEKTERCSLGTP